MLTSDIMAHPMLSRLQTVRSTPASLTVLTRTAQATKVALSVVRLSRSLAVAVVLLDTAWHSDCANLVTMLLGRGRRAKS